MLSVEFSLKCNDRIQFNQILNFLNDHDVPMSKALHSNGFTIGYVMIWDTKILRKIRIQDLGSMRTYDPVKFTGQFTEYIKQKKNGMPHLVQN